MNILLTKLIVQLGSAPSAFSPLPTLLTVFSSPKHLPKCGFNLISLAPFPLKCIPKSEIATCACLSAGMLYPKKEDWELNFSAMEALFHLGLQREPEPCDVSKLSSLSRTGWIQRSWKQKHTHSTDTRHTGRTHTHPDLRPREQECSVCSGRKHHAIYFVRRTWAIKGK